VRNDPDIFFVDSEGLNEFRSSTSVPRKSILALTYVSTVNVMVLANSLNSENINEICSFFSLIFFLNQENQYSNRTLLIFKDKRVIPIGKRLTSEKYIKLRKEQDEKILSNVIEIFSDNDLNFTDHQLKVICPPSSLKEKHHYWETMKDVVEYFIEISNQQQPITGE
jgi:hypothetical protein